MTHHDIPNEPPDKALAVDWRGYAWQRHGLLWHGTLATLPVSWHELVVDFGPLVVLAVGPLHPSQPSTPPVFVTTVGRKAPQPHTSLIPSPNSPQGPAS